MANKDGGKALYVPNECLTYIYHYRNNYNQNNLKKTVLNFFTGDEILLAKDVLWAKVSGLGDKKVCRDSSARLHQGMDLLDILGAFKKIDDNNIDSPTFVVFHLDHLPRHGPEEINVFSLAERISTMERELAAVKIDVGHVKANTATSKISTYATFTATQPLAVTKRNGQVVKQPMMSHCQLQTVRSAPGPSAQQRPQQQRKPSVAANEYVTVRNRRNRRQERITMVGTKKSEQFQGRRPRINLFVSRVPKDYPAQHIKDMIVDTGVEILNLILLSHENATMALYKLSIWKDDEEQLMKPDAWPQFISCRRYVRSRRRNDDHCDWGNWRNSHSDDGYGVFT